MTGSIYVNGIESPTWGKSLEADFEKGTWTFQMVGDDWTVSAGHYVLLHNDEYDAMMHERASLQDRVKHAEELLGEWMKGNPADRDLTKWMERVFRFFDPKP